MSMVIYIDEDWPYWSNGNRWIEAFLNYQMDYICDLIKQRGYVYLNQIYEILGVVWDTRCDNHCIENPDFTVVIGWDCKQNRWVIDISRE